MLIKTCNLSKQLYYGVGLFNERVDMIVKACISNVDCRAYHPSEPDTLPKRRQGGIFITFDIVPDPMLVWPVNPGMVAYCFAKIGVLFGAGVFLGNIHEHLESITETEWSGTHLRCNAKFNTLKEARAVFDRANDAGFVDIYLYDNDELIDKYD